MCVMVYIASDLPLPLCPFDKDHPSFNVMELPETCAAVKRHFTKPFIYLAGSHTGCGCGFENPNDKHGVDVGIAPNELAAQLESRRRLAEYLRNALDRQEAVELHACWACEEAREPERRGSILPEDLIDKHTYFLGDKNFEPESLTVRRK